MSIAGVRKKKRRMTPESPGRQTRVVLSFHIVNGACVKFTSF